MNHDLILHIIRNPWGWSEDEVRAARLAAADLIEQQAKEIEALRALLSDIKLFEVDSGVERIKKGEPAFMMPLELRKRMQAILTGQ